MIMSLKQREIIFKPRIKLNHNIYIYIIYIILAFITVDVMSDKILST